MKGRPFESGLGRQKRGGKMKPKEYRVLEMAVEAGAQRGVRRAYKHTDSPTEEQIALSVLECVMGEICEWFNFEDPEQQG